MATVVNLAKDTRASELGGSVASYLERVRDRRIDGLQQELMDNIGAAKDEAEATALFGDPKYQEVVTDPGRFQSLVTHYNNAPLGKLTALGYDKDGNQRIVSYTERDDLAEVFDKQNMSVERMRPFYAYNPDDEFDNPTSLGRFRSVEEAQQNLPEDRLLETTQVLDQEEMISAINFRAATSSAQDTRAQRYLAEQRFKFTKEGGHSPFAQLENDFSTGKISEEFYNDARKRLVHIWGRTPVDIQLEYKNKLEPRGAQVHSISEQMVFLMEAVAKDQNIITGSAKIPAIIDGIGSELATLASGLGYTRRPVQDYDAVFENNGLGGRSTAFKNMLTDVALGVAAMSGQEGRSLSDKDFDRFLKIVGTDISSGTNFITNLNQVMLAKQRQFKSEYAILARGPDGSPGNWESEKGKLPSFGTSRNASIKSWEAANADRFPDLVFPKTGDD